MNSTKFLFLFLFFLLSNSLFSQIKIKEIELDSIFEDSLYLNISESRPIIPLVKNWEVFNPESPETKTTVNIPSNFSNIEELTFNKKVKINSSDLLKHDMKIYFDGINYASEVLFNDVSLYKHFGGEIPFEVLIPNDIIKLNEENLITVKVFHNLSSDETIPVKQRFLFPANRGGILKESFIQFIPKFHVNNPKFKNSVNVEKSSAVVEVKFDLVNSRGKKSNPITNLKADLKITEINGNFTQTTTVNLNQNIKSAEISSQLNGIKLWDISNPVNYKAEIIIRNDSTIFDSYSSLLSFYELKKDEDKFLLNNFLFSFKGTTYFVNDKENFNLVTLEQLREDLQKIKSLGFNSVRFSKAITNNYLLKLCSEIGLFAFVELPINSIPDEIISSSAFIERSEGIANKYIEQISQFPSVAALGIGSSFLYKSEAQKSFIKKIANQLNQSSNLYLYASFKNYDLFEVNEIDLIGVELFDADLSGFNQFVKDNPTLKNKIFISEATYPAYNGSTNGYLNNYSFEAQAKYFEEIIQLSEDNDLLGFFINSMFDYHGDFASLSTGYNDENLYQIGIVREDRIVNTIASQVIASKLTDSERVTIPLGSKSDDSPMMYIIIGVVLSLIMALLFNSKRKFREDATRALLRPYNFYADIRDHRILSGLHATILMLILSAAMSLFLSSLLFYFKDSKFIEQILLSFGSENLISLYGYLAWNPIEGLIYLFVISVILVLLTSAVIKLASFFIKTKVFYSSIFFMVIWSSLPLAILLPLILVLYRILAAEVINLYILIFIGIYFLWLFQRLIKGIYVIFDVNRIAVYFYAFVFMFLIFGSFVFFYQLNYSTFYYIKNSLMQFGII